MNQLLYLFLSRCELVSIEKGVMTFSTYPYKVFPITLRYLPNVPRSEDTEIFLLIDVDKTGSISCGLGSAYDGIFDRSEPMNMVNATIPNIEQWVLSADAKLR